MANQTVNFTINLDGNAYTGIAQIDAALGNVLVNAKNTKSFFERFKTAAFNFDVITNAIGKVSQAFQSLVGSSLDFEQQQANMRTLLNGDAEATDNLIGKIREYGKATVYDRSGLIEAQKTMMSFGLDAEYAFGKLKNIGDIALGDKQKMQSLALAFSQMSSTGKLMGQDLLQMINAGFNPLEVISQKTGKSIAELKEEMSKGAISAEQVAQAFEWATEEGGRFYQGAETAAQTTAGKIAKVKDQIDDFKISLFEATGGLTAWIAEAGNMFVPISQAIPLFQMIGKGVVSTVKWCGANWSSFVKLVKTGVVNIALNMEIMKFSIMSAGGFFPWLRGVATTACRAISVAIMKIPIVGWIAAAVAAVIGLVTLLWNKSEGFRRLVFGTWEAVKAAVSNAWQYVKTAAQVTWEVLKRLFARLKETFSGLWERLKALFARLKSAFTEAWNHIKPVLTNIAEKVWGAIKVVMKVVAVVAMVAGAVIAVVGLLVKTVWDNLLKPMFQRLFSIVSTVVSWVGNAVGGIIGFVTSIPSRISIALDNVRTFFTDLWNSITGTVRNAVDRIIGFVTSIPGRVKTTIVFLWDNMSEPVHNAVEHIIGFVTSIPGRITDALDKLREFFTDLWNSVTTTVRNAVDRIIGFVTSIPGRVKTTIVFLWDNMSEPVHNAVEHIIGFVTSIPGRITDALDRVREFFAGLWNEVTKAAHRSIDHVTSFVQDLRDSITARLDEVRELYANLWDDITSAVHRCIDRITGIVQGLRDRVTEIFGKIGDFISGVWERVRESVGGAVDWISGKLEKVGGWIKTKIADPIKNAFTGMWDVIREVFDKMLTKLGKLFAPIRELWNKLFPKDKMKDVKLAYAEGAEKGTKSWRESKGDVDTGVETVVLDGKDGINGADGKSGKSGKDGKTKKELSDGTLGKNAGTVAGRAQQITIKLENMVGTMNFNGGLNENASNVESTLTEMLARILGMAQTAA